MRKIKRTQEPLFTLVDLTQVELDLISHLLGEIISVTYNGEEYDSYGLYSDISDFESGAVVEVRS